MIKTRIEKVKYEDLYCDLCEEQMLGRELSDRYGNPVKDINDADPFHRRCIELAENFANHKAMMLKIEKNLGNFKKA